MLPKSSRRAFLAASSAAALASTVPAARNPLCLGGPIFLKSDDPDELAAEHRRLGYSAAYCPEVKLSDMDRIKAIERAFARAKVTIGLSFNSSAKGGGSDWTFRIQLVAEERKGTGDPKAE